MAGFLSLEVRADAQEACVAEDLTTTGIVVSAGGAYEGQGPTHAFNGAGDYYSGFSTANTFIGRDLVTPKYVARIEFRGTGSYSFYGRVQFSDDGTTYVDTSVTVNIGPEDHSLHSYAVPFVGPHRFWVVRDLQDDAYHQIDEIHMFGACATCLLDDVSRVGGVVAGGTAFSGQGAANAFNGPNTWYSGYSSAATYIGRDFGVDRPQSVRRIEVYGTSSYGFSGKVQYSDDGVTFVDTGATIAAPPYNPTTWFSVAVPDSGTHRFWVIRDLQEDAYHQIDEIRLFACAACALDDVTALGSIASVGTAYAGQGPSQAFGNGGSYYSGVSASAPYIGRDFGEAQARTVVRMDFAGTASFSFYGKVQYSDDGVVFHDADVTVNIAPGDSTVRTYPIPDAGPHRFWVIRDLQDDAYHQIDEIHMYALAELTPVGSVVYGGSWFGSQAPENAFDGTDSWYSGSSSVATFIGRDFGNAPQSVRRIGVHGTSSYTFNGSVQYSDDGVTFADAGTVIAVDAYDSTWRFFNVPDVGPHGMWVVRDRQDDAYLQVSELRLYPWIGALGSAFVPTVVVPPPAVPSAQNLCAGSGLFPSGLAWPHSGGLGEFDVNFRDSCEWTATSSASWLLPLTTLATGSGKLHFAVGLNDTGTGRSGRITISGGGITATFTVTQGSSDGSTGGQGDGGTTWPSTLTAGQTLSYLMSPDGRFLFASQTDGNIVLYQGSTVLWSSGTSGAGYAIMQGDGNFVRYSASGAAPWHSNTVGHPGASLAVQNDGNVTITDLNGTLLWLRGTSASGTAGGPGTDEVGSGCTATGSPRYFSAVPQGQTVTIHVNAAIGCQAAALVNADWLTPTIQSGSGEWATDVIVQANPASVPRVGAVFLGDTVIVVDQAANGATDQSVTIHPSFCDDSCGPAPGSPNGVQLVPRPCGEPDCDGNGMKDDDDDTLANRWFPNIHTTLGDCGRILDGYWQPVVFRVHYLSHDGVIDQNRLAINYEVLYSVDCGPPGGGIIHGTVNSLFSHRGDNEPFVVFLNRAADGTWDTTESFQMISAAAHVGTLFEVQSWSNTLNSNGKPDLWIGFQKHGNFAQRSQCSPDWLNFCVDGPAHPAYRLFNVGQRLAPFIHNLKPIVPSWNGQYVWGCGQFFEAGIISDDMYLDPYAYKPVPVGEGDWDNVEFAPHSSQPVLRSRCGG